MKSPTWSLLIVALAGLFVGCSPPSAASSPAPPDPAIAESLSPVDLESSTAPAAVDHGVDSSTPAAPAATNSQRTEAAEPAPTPKVNRPPRADRQPTKPGEAEKITFDDLNLQMLPNIVFRPFMVNDRVQQLEGKRVSITGYMHGAAAGTSGLDHFVLLKNTECKFGKDGQADHLAMVHLKSGTKTKYTASDVKVEGTLRVEPYTGPDGNTWSIYNLDDAQIR